MATMEGGPSELPTSSGSYEPHMQKFADDLLQSFLRATRAQVTRPPAGASEAPALPDPSVGPGEGAAASARRPSDAPPVASPRSARSPVLPTVTPRVRELSIDLTPYPHGAHVAVEGRPTASEVKEAISKAESRAERFYAAPAQAAGSVTEASGKEGSTPSPAASAGASVRRGSTIPPSPLAPVRRGPSGSLSGLYRPGSFRSDGGYTGITGTTSDCSSAACSPVADSEHAPSGAALAGTGGTGATAAGNLPNFGTGSPSRPAGRELRPHSRSMDLRAVTVRGVEGPAEWVSGPRGSAYGVKDMGGSSAQSTGPGARGGLAIGIGLPSSSPSGPSSDMSSPWDISSTPSDHGVSRAAALQPLAGSLGAFPARTFGLGLNLAKLQGGVDLPSVALNVAGLHAQDEALASPSLFASPLATAAGAGVVTTGGGHAVGAQGHRAGAGEQGRRLHAAVSDSDMLGQYRAGSSPDGLSVQSAPSSARVREAPPRHPVHHTHTHTHTAGYNSMLHGRVSPAPSLGASSAALSPALARVRSLSELEKSAPPTLPPSVINALRRQRAMEEAAGSLAMNGPPGLGLHPLYAAGTTSQPSSRVSSPRGAMPVAQLSSSHLPAQAISPRQGSPSSPAQPTSPMRVEKGTLPSAARANAAKAAAIALATATTSSPGLQSPGQAGVGQARGARARANTIDALSMKQHKANKTQEQLHPLLRLPENAVPGVSAFSAPKHALGVGPNRLRPSRLHGHHNLHHLGAAPRLSTCISSARGEATSSEASAIRKLRSVSEALPSSDYLNFSNVVPSSHGHATAQALVPGFRRMGGFPSAARRQSAASHSTALYSGIGSDDEVEPTTGVQSTTSSVAGPAGSLHAEHSAATSPLAHASLASPARAAVMRSASLGSAADLSWAGAQLGSSAASVGASSPRSAAGGTVRQPLSARSASVGGAGPLEPLSPVQRIHMESLLESYEPPTDPFADRALMHHHPTGVRGASGSVLGSGRALAHAHAEGGHGPAVPSSGLSSGMRTPPNAGQSARGSRWSFSSSSKLQGSPHTAALTGGNAATSGQAPVGNTGRDRRMQPFSATASQAVTLSDHESVGEMTVGGNTEECRSRAGSFGSAYSGEGQGQQSGGSSTVPPPPLPMAQRTGSPVNTSGSPGGASGNAGPVSGAGSSVGAGVIKASAPRPRSARNLAAVSSRKDGPSPLRRTLAASVLNLGHSSMTGAIGGSGHSPILTAAVPPPLVSGGSFHMRDGRDTALSPTVESPVGGALSSGSSSPVPSASGSALSLGLGGDRGDNTDQHALGAGLKADLTAPPDAEALQSALLNMCLSVAPVDTMDPASQGVNLPGGHGHDGQGVRAATLKDGPQSFFSNSSASSSATGGEAVPLTAAAGVFLTSSAVPPGPAADGVVMSLSAFEAWCVSDDGARFLGLTATQEAGMKAGDRAKAAFFAAQGADSARAATEGINYKAFLAAVELLRVQSAGGPSVPASSL